MDADETEPEAQHITEKTKSTKTIPTTETNTIQFRRTHSARYERKPIFIKTRRK